MWKIYGDNEIELVPIATVYHRCSASLNLQEDHPSGLDSFESMASRMPSYSFQLAYEVVPINNNLLPAIVDNLIVVRHTID